MSGWFATNSTIKFGGSRAISLVNIVSNGSPGSNFSLGFRVKTNLAPSGARVLGSQLLRSSRLAILPPGLFSSLSFGIGFCSLLIVRIASIVGALGCLVRLSIVEIVSIARPFVRILALSALRLKAVTPSTVWAEVRLKFTDATLCTGLHMNLLDNVWSQYSGNAKGCQDGM